MMEKRKYDDVEEEDSISDDLLTLFLLSPDLIGANDVMPVLAVFQLSGLPPLNVNVRIAFSARKAFI